MEPAEANRPPEAVKAALRANYDAIIHRFQRRLEINQVVGHPTPTEVLIGNLNVAIKDMFGWNLVNQVALYKGIGNRIPVLDPVRIQEEMKKIKELYDTRYKEHSKDLLSGTPFLQFNDMYAIYAAVWEEKRLMPATPEKRSRGKRT